MPLVEYEAAEEGGESEQDELEAQCDEEQDIQGSSEDEHMPSVFSATSELRFPLLDDVLEGEMEESELELLTWGEAKLPYRQIVYRDWKVKQDRKRLIKERRKDKLEFEQIMRDFK